MYETFFHVVEYILKLLKYTDTDLKEAQTCPLLSWHDKHAPSFHDNHASPQKYHSVYSVEEMIIKIKRPIEVSYRYVLLIM
jgi:hypothetical protein